MRRLALQIISTFAAFVIIFELQRVLFYISYAGLMPGVRALGDCMLHGFAMDCSMAGYLTVIPAIVAIASIWTHGVWTATLRKVYCGVAAGAIALVTVLDLGLYSYWNFRIDATPIFYFTTSPSSALASVEWWMYPVGIVAVALIGAAIYSLLALTMRISLSHNGNRLMATICGSALTAALFIPIRGGVGVSTMNPGHAYFSADARLNHAALNPQFNLMYSLMHQKDFGNQFRFMTEGEADLAIGRFEDACRVSQAVDGIGDHFLATGRPDVYLVILESFSAHLMPSLGGDSVAMRLDGIAREGLLFSDFYASSFRTDRALPAILSGMPAQPTTSVMKFVEKTAALPSIAVSLAKEGYETAYYYGGDLNFTNMRGYLVNAGFGTIVGDSDFPSSDHAGKWGVPDGAVFDRALADARGYADSVPHFTVVQTSSSHEPFEVPYASRRFAANPRRNAFAYADSCLGAWYAAMKASPRWDKTLVVIVADHQGCWPEKIDDPFDRHHIPLVFAGGAMADSPKTVGTTGCQPDIAATLLGALGIGSEAYPFSHNLLDRDEPHYAFFSEPGLAGLVGNGGRATLSTDTGDPVCSDGEMQTQAARAILQRLYDYLDNL